MSSMSFLLNVVKFVVVLPIVVAPLTHLGIFRRSPLSEVPVVLVNQTSWQERYKPF